MGDLWGDEGFGGSGFGGESFGGEDDWDTGDESVAADFEEGVPDPGEEGDVHLGLLGPPEDDAGQRGNA